MRMTNKLVNQVLKTLMAVAISANGGIELDENGELIPNNEILSKCEEYAKNTFVEILTSWEQLLGEKWEIEAE